MARVRQNITTGEWVVVAPERSVRPSKHAEKLFSETMVHEYPCNFCHGQVAWHQRYPDLDTKNLYVIPNKFPILSEVDQIEDAGHGFYEDSNSYGVHEVIVFKSASDSLLTAKTDKILELLKMMQARMNFHQQDETLLSFTPTYNHGKMSGASMAHPHAQFMASDLVSPRLQQELTTTKQFFQKNHHCVFCNILDFERTNHVRCVYDDDGALAFTAFAPRFPFETWVIPEHHQMSFAEASDHTLEKVAGCMHKVFAMMDDRLSHPSLNWFIHTARNKDFPYDDSYHWHIEITPRLSKYGGYELATDTIVQTISPEVAAKYLRS